MFMKIDIKNDRRILKHDNTMEIDFINDRRVKIHTDEKLRL